VRLRIRHWKRWLAVAVGSAVLLVVGAPYAYIHFIEGAAPAPLALSSPSGTAPSSGESNIPSDGTWKITTGSIVGYRVQEVLFGQTNTAVGRTRSITGSMTVQGTTVTAARFTVDMTTVTSDQARRDEQFNGRIMETNIYPTATFKLIKPIRLRSIPRGGAERPYPATGDLTLHGVTRTVRFRVTGRLTGSKIQVVGSMPVTFADYHIQNPSFAGVVTTQDHGTLEFELNLVQG